MPLPRWIHSLNTLLHKEPYSSIAYGLFWITFLTLSTPISIVVLTVRMLVRVVLLWATTSTTIDPREGNKEMAILVTGCDSGFGKEIALQAAEAGFVVFAGCLDPYKAKKLHYENMTEAIYVLQMDVTSDKQVEESVESIEKWLRDESTKTRVLHAVINNAGVSNTALFDWSTLQDYRRDFEVNFFGIVRVCKAFLPILKDQSCKAIHRDARIFNLTSVAAVMEGMAGGGTYSSSKHAAQAFSECIRRELANFEIQVGTVNPGFHQTPMLDTAGDRFRTFWETKLPKAVKEEYGEEMFLAIHKQVASLSTLNWFDPAIVATQVVDGLLMKRIPPQISVGLDARFLISPLRMLSPWTSVFLSPPSLFPVPACMKKTKLS